MDESLWRLLRWRNRRRIRFDAVLPSNLPGAVFTATVSASWLLTAGTSPRMVPVIRTQLRRQASEITNTYSVLDAVAARDAVLVEIARTSVLYDDVPVDVCTDVRLRVDTDSRCLAEQHLVRLRELRLSQETARSSLVFLRDEVLAEPALAKIWWMQQHSEHAAAIDKEFLAEIQADAAAARTSTQPGHDGLAPILLEFMKWLSNDEATRRVALKTLHMVMERLGPPELPARLRKVSPELQPVDETSNGEATPSQIPTGHPTEGRSAAES